MQKTVTLDLDDNIQLVVPHATVVEGILAKLRGGHALPPGGVPAIGQYWPGQGGIRAVPDLKDAGGRVYDLVVVTRSDKKTPVFYENREWGNHGKEVEGAKDKRDGVPNTATLVKADNALAIEISNETTVDGQKDCYWLSQAELMGCYIYVPELFGTDMYWSSSQLDSYSAWVQDFEHGNVYYWGKASKLKAFPVRRVYR